MDKVIYDYAMRLVGLPYRWGGDDTIDGFDCSGLVVELLQAAGKLPHGVDENAQGLHKRFKGKSLSDLPCFGTLAFYGSSLHEITHVAFCLTDTHVLEAGGGGSSTTSKEKAASQNAFVRIRPAKYRKDFLCFIYPS